MGTVDIQNGQLIIQSRIITYGNAADLAVTENIRSQGETMHPKHRKVRQENIDLLKLHKLDFKNGLAILGASSSVWHPDHADFAPPGIYIA